MAQVERNGFHSGGWAEGDRGGGPGAGKQRGPAGVVAIRTDGEQGASYAGISPDSVGAGHDLANGLASPARRHPSGALLLINPVIGIGSPSHSFLCVHVLSRGGLMPEDLLCSMQSPFPVRWIFLPLVSVMQYRGCRMSVMRGLALPEPGSTSWTWEQWTQRKHSY